MFSKSRLALAKERPEREPFTAVLPVAELIPAFVENTENAWSKQPRYSHKHGIRSKRQVLLQLRCPLLFLAQLKHTSVPTSHNATRLACPPTAVSDTYRQGRAGEVKTSTSCPCSSTSETFYYFSRGTAFPTYHGYSYELAPPPVLFLPRNFIIIRYQSCFR